MRIAFCDDDAVCREQIAEIIKEYAGNRSISVSLFESPGQLLEAFESGSSRVVNLDYIVEMDGANLVFRNGTKVYIGRRTVRDIRSVWYDFWFDGGE